MQSELKLISTYIIYRITEQYSKLLELFTETAILRLENKKIYVGKDQLDLYFKIRQKSIPNTSDPKFENNEYSIILIYIGGWKKIKLVFKFEDGLISEIIHKNIGWIKN